MESESTKHQFEAISLDQTVDLPYQKQKYFGLMIPLFVHKVSGEPLFLLGPHFYVFIPAWIISAIIFIYIITSLHGKAYPPFLYTSIASGIFFLFMYLKLGLSKPGIASCQQEPNLLTRSQDRYCIPCKIVRPKGTNHCHYCDICIHGIDHHCPWVGKCIGRDNICAFYLFLSSIILAIAVLMGTAMSVQKPK